MLKYRTFGYGHSFGVLSHYYGREAGLELREDIDTVLEPGMVVSMEVRKKKHIYISKYFKENDTKSVHTSFIPNIFWIIHQNW